MEILGFEARFLGDTRPIRGVWADSDTKYGPILGNFHPKKAISGDQSDRLLVLTIVGRPAIKLIYEAFRSGDFAEAERLAAEERSKDFDDPLVLAALHSAVYWKPKRLEWEEKRQPLERARFLVQEWVGFRYRYLPRLNSDFEENLYHLRFYLFGKALEDFQEALYQTNSHEERSALTMDIGRCHKQMGDYKKALGVFEVGTEDARKEDAEFLSESADCLDMMSQSEPARLLFREAFFLGPQRIELDLLLSPMIQSIRHKIAPLNLRIEDLKEWVPVYGVLLGLFNVRRDLKPLEVSRLKQEVTNLKMDYNNSRNRSGVSLPRLLNRYFWLLDHYRDTHEERSKWEEILLNIKMIDPEIYRMYTKN